MSAEIVGLRLKPAVAGESWDVVAATGKIGPDANQVVKIGSRVAGKIVKVSSNVGDPVRKGQVLATVSCVELSHARAAYRQAVARLRASKEAYRRQVDLATLGSFSNRPVEEARSQYTAAVGELAQAKGELAQNRSELVRTEIELAQCSTRMDRARELYKDQIVSRQDLEAAEAEFQRDSADVDAMRAQIRRTEAKIQQADAAAKIAKGYLDREEKVLGSGLLSRREIQTAKAEMSAAELECRGTAEAIRVLGASPAENGDTITITSPISGRVVDRTVTLGETVEPSATLFTVMDLSNVWVEANVYEKDLSKIRQGQTAEIRVQAYPNRVFNGSVAYIGDVLDRESRTARVRCVVSNPARLLRPEMFASICIATARRGRAVLIPRDAVLDEAGRKIVFLSCMECSEDKTAGRNACGAYDKRDVEVGPTHGTCVEVRGVQPGELVVATGAYQLKSALSSGQLKAGCTDH